MLQNKLGITDPKILADAEERIGKFRAREMYDSGRLGTMPKGTFAGLAEIHRRLFGDIYPFAGELRTVNVYKGGARFAPIETLVNAVRFVDIMPQGTVEDIITKSVGMYIAHPFRTGTDRALRIWLDVMLAATAGRIVDWVSVYRQRDIYVQSMSDPRRLTAFLTPLLTPNVTRANFLVGIDASFALEGYTRYKTAEVR